MAENKKSPNEIKGAFCSVAEDGHIHLRDKAHGFDASTNGKLSVEPGQGIEVEAPASATYSKQSNTYGDYNQTVSGKMFIENDVCTFKQEGQIWGGISAPLVEPGLKK